MRHNIAFLLFFPEHEMQARFSQRAFFRSDMHTVIVNTAYFSPACRPTATQVGGRGKSVLEVRASALR